MQCAQNETVEESKDLRRKVKKLEYILYGKKKQWLFQFSHSYMNFIDWYNTQNTCTLFYIVYNFTYRTTILRIAMLVQIQQSIGTAAIDSILRY